jgi:hypothetical protein
VARALISNSVMNALESGVEVEHPMAQPLCNGIEHFWPPEVGETQDRVEEVDDDIYGYVGAGRVGGGHFLEGVV